MPAPQGPWLARLAFAIIGTIALALGIVGAFVPLLPTVPLVLLAAACFAKASTRLENWLLKHPRFGPVILDWRERGAISRKGKTAATLGMAVGFGVFLYTATPPLWLAGFIAAIFLLILAYILSRPS
ncbi:MAG: YbaN family protein [Pseudomonadota bacterium]